MVNALEESLARVLHQGCWSEVRHFGGNSGDFAAQGPAEALDVLQQGRKVAHVAWSPSGQHNRLRLAAIAAAEHVGVAPTVAAQALARFQT